MLLVNGAHVPLTISERFYRDTTNADAQELKRRHEATDHIQLEVD